MAEFTENDVLANLSEMGYSFDDDIIPATTDHLQGGRQHLSGSLLTAT